MDYKTILIDLFGASGWIVVIAKIGLDVLDNRRKKREAEIKAGEKMVPLLNELHSAYYLSLYKQIKRNSEYGEDGKVFTADSVRALRNYPAKLEEIGALVMAGVLSRAQVYDAFGEQIVACARANFLWESEDSHYWQLFNALVSAMEQERKNRNRYA